LEGQGQAPMRDSEFENIHKDPRWKVVVQCISWMQ
jgi:hypothetical protein